MALRATKGDEKPVHFLVRKTPEPSRDRQGVYMALRAAETDESQSAMR